MAMVAAAAGAGDFHTAHAVAVVDILGDVGIVDGLVKARPAGPGVELGVGAVHRQATGGAGEDTGPLFVVQRTGERPLGTVFPQNVVGLGRKLCFPVAVGLLDGNYLAGDGRRVVFVVRHLVFHRGGRIGGRNGDFGLGITGRGAQHHQDEKEGKESHVDGYLCW